MSITGEAAFIKDFTTRLSALPVQYPETFIAPPQTRPKRPVKISSASLPKRRVLSAANTDDNAFTLKIKTLGAGSVTFNIPVGPSTLVGDLKAQLATQVGVPSPAYIRLVVRGKALADSQEIREHDLKEGSIVHMMVKQAPEKGATDIETKATATPSTSSKPAPTTLSSAAQETLKAQAFWHGLERYLQTKLGKDDASIILRRFGESYDASNLL